jgi:hypothetical protein
MKKNVGTIDTAIRLVIAALIAVLYFTGVITGPLGITLLVVAGLLVLTSVVSICPLYSVLKISTRKKK